MSIGYTDNTGESFFLSDDNPWRPAELDDQDRREERRYHERRQNYDPYGTLRRHIAELEEWNRFHRRELVEIVERRAVHVIVSFLFGAMAGVAFLTLLRMF